MTNEIRNSKDRTGNRAPVSFWVLGLALVVYVGACTIQRDNSYGIDAWEHQRAVLALTRHLWKPGNPTYDLDVPSVRYSPYTVALAVLCRTAHVNPYDALSGAAVVNTALLVIGVWLLLASFGEAASAMAVLVVMVCLWGGAPGWANSYALSDLPWHQVDPGAFAFALVLISWALFRWITIVRGGAIKWAAIGILLTIAMLTHGMTGAFGFCGLFVIALVGPRSRRGRMAAAIILLAPCVFAVCLAWPWYSFWAALRSNTNPHYWFEPDILRKELLVWSAPAILCSLFALPLRERPLVRTCIAGGVMAMGAGVLAALIHSPTLARFPLPGMIYFHLMVGIFAHEAGIFRPSTWPGRLRSLVGPIQQASYPILQTVLVLVLAYFLVPQLYEIVRTPYLARPYLVRLFHRDPKGLNVRRDFAMLLRPVGENDVVLADDQTSWLVPSTTGKIVTAIHYELFVPNQWKRSQDVSGFFTTDDERRREACIRRYHVKWILLNPLYVPEPTFSALVRPPAVVGRTDGLVLMDAARWIDSAGRGATPFPDGSIAAP